MVLLFITGSIFLFLSLSIGYIINKAIKGSKTYTVPLFEILLTGTAAITVYLNLVSFFFPSDYIVLIPLLVMSLFICFKTPITIEVSRKLSVVFSVVFNKANMLPAFSICIVIILFIIVPPFNRDMGGYHILAILWTEKFKVIPGVANLFPQFGYNSSFFVLSAAFSFTDIFEQSVYPINMVLISAFYLWLLNKSFSYTNWRKPLMWLMLIIFFRQFLINLSAPSPDALFMILVLFIFFLLFDLGKNDLDEGQYTILILLAMFAVIIKISAIPILLISFIHFIIFKKTIQQRLKWLLKLTGFATLIIAPWIARNIILSGYLIFPVPFADIFSFDWKVPMDMLIAEKQLISNAPRMISNDFAYVDQLSFASKIMMWMPGLWACNKLDFAFVCLAFASPLIACFTYRKEISVYNLRLWVWLSAYAGIWYWIIGSPDIRFGFPYLASAVFFPFISLASYQLLTQPATKLFSFVTILFCFYYAVKSVNMLAPYQAVQWAFKPIKHPEYFKNNDMNTFRYVLLNNNIKLYIHDSAHHSINAPLPSCSPYREGIRMRGNSLQEGFKTIQ